uniref:Ras homolog family member V n=1 Tax=Oryzias latipes TaxID=8090 RepID=A0A3P9H864_ORYLA
MAQICQRIDEPNRLREELSLMLVGDGAVGKTTMIISYIFNGFNSEYKQTAFDVFTGLIHVNGVPIRLKLIDSAGQDGFGHLCSLCFPHVDVFILCFSLVNPRSFANISSKWIPQIRAANRTSPVVLVGSQSDLCHNMGILIHLNHQRTRPVSFEKAKRLAHRIRAHSFIECSALTQHNLKDVFDHAVYAAIEHKDSKSRKFTLFRRLKSFLYSFRGLEFSE